MEAGRVVKVAMPQADGVWTSRPAVLVKAFPPYGDWLMVGISGSLDLAVPDLDIPIGSNHPSFLSARLKYPGIIRLGHAHVVAADRIEGVIGALDPATLGLIKQRLAAFILSP